MARLRAGQAGAHPQQREEATDSAPTNWSVLQGFDTTPLHPLQAAAHLVSPACAQHYLAPPALPLSPRTFMKSMVSLVGTSPATRPQYLHAWGSRAPPGGWGQQADTAARHGRPAAGCTFGQA